MRNRESPALELYPRASKQLRRFTWLVHIAGLLVCLLLFLHTAWALMLVPIVWLSLGHSMRAQPRIVRLIHRNQGEWTWEDSNGQRFKGTHSPASLRLSRLVILHLIEVKTGAMTRVVLPRDSLPGEQHRRLRVALGLPI